MSTWAKFSSNASSCSLTSRLARRALRQRVRGREQEALGGLRALRRAELADPAQRGLRRRGAWRSCPRPSCSCRRPARSPCATGPRAACTSTVSTAFGPSGHDLQRGDRVAVRHAALERVLARAQLAAVAADGGVELEEARRVDDARGREDLADLAGVGALGDRDRDACPRPRRGTAGTWRWPRTARRAMTASTISAKIRRPQCAPPPVRCGVGGRRRGAFGAGRRRGDRGGRARGRAAQRHGRPLVGLVEAVLLGGVAAGDGVRVDLVVALAARARARRRAAARRRAGRRAAPRAPRSRTACTRPSAGGRTRRARLGGASAAGLVGGRRRRAARGLDGRRRRAARAAPRGGSARGGRLVAAAAPRGGCARHGALGAALGAAPRAAAPRRAAPRGAPPRRGGSRGGSSSAAPRAAALLAGAVGRRLLDARLRAALDAADSSAAGRPAGGPCPRTPPAAAGGPRGGQRVRPRRGRGPQMCVVGPSACRTRPNR